METRITRENHVCFWAKVDQLLCWLYSGCGHRECVIELAWRRHPEEGKWQRSRKGRGLNGLRPSHMWTPRLYRIAGLWVGMQVCTVSLDEWKFRWWFWDGDFRWLMKHSGVRNTCVYEVYMFKCVFICMYVHTCMETEVDSECFLLPLSSLVFGTRFLTEPGILWLGDWLASKLLPLLPQSLDYRYVGLVTQTRPLMLVCEALYCLSYLSGV